jgi:hypothetical protein
VAEGKLENSQILEKWHTLEQSMSQEIKRESRKD